MQTTHRLASTVLQRDPIAHEHAERLARIVMKLFDQGIRDPKTLAATAIDEETAISDPPRLHLLGNFVSPDVTPPAISTGSV